MEVHKIEPVYDSNSRVLILGSFPSVKSREENFYYAHPQNRFWHIMEILFSTTLVTVDAKRKFLLNEHIALWDVISSCEIVGSSDISITNVSVNDIASVLSHSNINRIFINGSKANELYMKYIYPDIKIKPSLLPSTSPANARWNLDSLLIKWKEVKDAIC